MTIPGSRDAEAITWHADYLLSYAPVLPPALATTLRAYREQLIRQCATQPWARPGSPARYARLATAIDRQVRDGTLAPGQRLPSLTHLEKRYHAREATMRQALLLLIIWGRLAREHHTYYVLPPLPGPWQEGSTAVTHAPAREQRCPARHPGHTPAPPAPGGQQ